MARNVMHHISKKSSEREKARIRCVALYDRAGQGERGLSACDRLVELHGMQSFDFGAFVAQAGYDSLGCCWAGIGRSFAALKVKRREMALLCIVSEEWAAVCCR
jgi:hypothetical protein